MANIWFTSDLHFGHTKIKDFCPDTRPWDDVTEMNTALVDYWNNTVKPEDTIYHLGDFSFTNRKNTEQILAGLNGQKFFVSGNHDGQLREQWAKKYLTHRADYMKHKIAGQDFILFHYPIWEWEKCQHGSIHLHGHIHDRDSGIEGKILNACWDKHGKFLHVDEVLAIVKDKPIRNHH